jgi:hypothetical protein
MSPITSCQYLVWKLMTLFRKVMRLAPRMGPANVPRPPTSDITTTFPERIQSIVCGNV